MFVYLYFSHKMGGPIGTQQLEDQPLENQDQRLILESTGQMTQSPPGPQASTPHIHMSTKYHQEVNNTVSVLFIINPKYVLKLTQQYPFTVVINLANFK